MRELLIIADASFVIGPSTFAAIEIPPGCVFYVHRKVMARCNAAIEREIASGMTKLPEGLTVPMLAISRQAWALAQLGVAGRA
jgi:hypothetical protein